MMLLRQPVFAGNYLCFRSFHSRRPPCISFAKSAQIPNNGGVHTHNFSKDGRSGALQRHNSSTTPGVYSSLHAAEPLPLAPHVGEITSTGNSFIKFCVRLRQSASFRLETGRLLVAGTIPLREICKPRLDLVASEDHDRGAQEPRIELLFCISPAVRAGANRDILELAERVVVVSENVMSRLSGVENVGKNYLAAILPLPSSYLYLPSTDAATPGAVEALQRKDKDEVSRQPEYDSYAVTAMLGKWAPGRPQRIVVLDGVQDPGNMGTLIRTALAFQWDAVFCLPGCCDPFNDKALRASRGASFRLPLALGDWSALDTLAHLYDMRIFAGEPAPLESTGTRQPNLGPSFGSSRRTEPLSEVINGRPGRDEHRSKQSTEEDPPFADERVKSHRGLVIGDSSFSGQDNSVLRGPICLVLGSEGQGASERTLQMSTPISIAMPGEMESLNVAVAGGIFMYLLSQE